MIKKENNKEIRNRKIYISGGVTGVSDYMEHFEKAERKLKQLGYEVVNPVKIHALMPKSSTYEEYMDISFALLKQCDSIYMLSNWEHSSGAKREAKLAKDKGLEFMYETEPNFEKVIYKNKPHFFINPQISKAFASNRSLVIIDSSKDFIEFLKKNSYRVKAYEEGVEYEYRAE